MAVPSVQIHSVAILNLKAVGLGSVGFGLSRSIRLDDRPGGYFDNYSSDREHRKIAKPNAFEVVQTSRTVRIDCKWTDVCWRVSVSAGGGHSPIGKFEVTGLPDVLRIKTCKLQPMIRSRRFSATKGTEQAPDYWRQRPDVTVLQPRIGGWVRPCGNCSPTRRNGNTTLHSHQAT